MDSQEQVTESSQTEVVVEREQDTRSIRDALAKNLDEKPVGEPVQAEVTESQATQAATEPVVERVPLVPPADMNKQEKEAFLNPTVENAHILQQYMNRRAYETRSDYQRKMVEVEQLKQQTAGVYDVLKEYENDYAKHGISVADIAKRSIAWDKAMQANPVQTALEWLDSYGVNLQDLYNGYSQQPQQPTQNYLTREDAERIAEEKFQAIQAQEKQNAVAYYNERLVESFMKNKPL